MNSEVLTNWTTIYSAKLDSIINVRLGKDELALRGANQLNHHSVPIWIWIVAWMRDLARMSWSSEVLTSWTIFNPHLSPFS